MLANNDLVIWNLSDYLMELQDAVCYVGQRVREDIVSESAEEHLSFVGADEIDEEFVIFTDELPLKPSDFSDNLVDHHNFIAPIKYSYQQQQ